MVELIPCERCGTAMAVSDARLHAGDWPTLCAQCRTEDREGAVSSGNKPASTGAAEGRHDQPQEFEDGSSAGPDADRGIPQILETENLSELAYLMYGAPLETDVKRALDRLHRPWPADVNERKKKNEDV